MKRKPFEEKRTVMYFGFSGYTQPCLQAIVSILNSGILPERVTIVRTFPDKYLFLFWNCGYIPLIVVPSGFASGYLGEGPTAFALAICLIREKGVPIGQAFILESEFENIDKGNIKNADDQVFKDIISSSENCSWPWYDWVPEIYEKALERGQLWRHQYLQNYKSVDSISIAISNVDLFNQDLGRKLRLALDKISNGIHVEDWQNAGILVRDAWIELSLRLCDLEKIDASDIEKDKVIDKLKKLKLDEEIISLAKASLDLSLKIQHDRKIKKETANACVITSIFTMQSIVNKYIDPEVTFK